MIHAGRRRLWVTTAIIAVALMTPAGYARAETAKSFPSFLLQGRPVVSPLGYLDFCRRHADQCNTDDHARAMLASNVVLPSDAGNNSPAAFNVPRPSGAFDWSLVFQKQAPEPDHSSPSIEQAANVGEDRTNAPVLFFAAVSPTLSDERWQILEDVNALVNVTVRSVSDMRHYGVEDFWELAIDNGGSAGDCEDYVLQKRKMLIARGFPMSSLSIALVQTRWGQSHAVLVVFAGSDAYVLDNLTSYIKPWNTVDYRWVKWQLPTKSGAWVQPS